MQKRLRQFVVCVRNEGYDVSLERRKIYVSLADDEAAKHGLMRVVDESGEDYLYPLAFFAPIELPPSVRRAVMQAAYLGVQRTRRSASSFFAGIAPARR